jgi:hypothetical protein
VFIAIQIIRSHVLNVVFELLTQRQHLAGTVATTALGPCVEPPVLHVLWKGGRSRRNFITGFTSVVKYHICFGGSKRDTAVQQCGHSFGWQVSQPPACLILQGSVGVLCGWVGCDCQCGKRDTISSRQCCDKIIIILQRADIVVSAASLCDAQHV